MFLPFLFFFLLKETYTASLANLKKEESKVMKIVNSRRWSIYAGAGITVTRSERSPYTFIHNNLMKRQFTNKMSKFSYKSKDNNGKDVVTLVDFEKLHKLFNYMSGVISDVREVDSILYYTIRPSVLAGCSDNEYLVKSLLSICGILPIVNYINATMGKCMQFYFYSFTRPLNMEVGATNELNYNHNVNQDKFYYIEDKKLHYDKIHEINELNKSLVDDKLDFFQQLVAVGLEDKSELHFFIVDMNLKLHYVQKDNYKSIKDIKLSPGNKELYSLLKKEIKEAHEKKVVEKGVKKEKYTKDKVSFYSDLFKKNNSISNHMTFLSLFSNEKSYEEYLVMLGDFSLFKDILSSREVKFTVDNINTALFYLWGFQGNIKASQGFLPIDYILNNDSTSIKKEREDNKYPDINKNIYSFPDYTWPENIDIFKNGMRTLPQLNTIDINELSMSCFVGAFSERICASIFFNYVSHTNITFNGPFSLDILLGFAPLGSFYICGVVRAIFNPHYHFNKYCDMAFGIGFIIKFSFLLLQMHLTLDPYNNLLCVRLGLYATKCLYGKEVFAKEEFMNAYATYL